MRPLLFLLTSFFSLSLMAQRGPTPVFVKKARNAEIVNKLKVTGSLKAASTSEVASIEAGRVEEVKFKSGETVKAGQVLARIDDRHIKLDIEETKAKLAEVEAGISRLKEEMKLQIDDLESLENAVKKFKGAVSDREIRAARLKSVTTKGQISELEASKATLNANLKKLQTSLEDTVIKAPFDGAILKRHITKGSWLASGGVVASLQSYKLEAVLEIPERINTEFLNDDTVAILVGDDMKKVALKNLRIIRSVDTDSRNYSIKGTVTDPQGLLPGMSIISEIPTGQKASHLLIPTDAIQRNGAGYFVFKVIPGQQGTSAAPISVQVLFRTGTETAVISPAIQDGDQIVVEGNERLFPMMPVKATLVEK